MAFMFGVFALMVVSVIIMDNHDRKMERVRFQNQINALRNNMGLPVEHYEEI